jgi:Rod binding domain-containing protein
MNPLTAASSALAPAATTEAPVPSSARAEPSPEILQAAREFETIFLRSLLGSLEKTTQAGTNAPLKSGQSTYGSMVVGAMADSMAGAGGIGLAEIIARAMTLAESSAKTGASGQ